MAVFDVVFEEGGAKGSAFVGALTALEPAHHITRRLIGTSAGGWSAYVRWGLKLGRESFDLLLLVSMSLVPLLCAALFAMVALRGQARG